MSYKHDSYELKGRNNKISTSQYCNKSDIKTR